MEAKDAKEKLKVKTKNKENATKKRKQDEGSDGVEVMSDPVPSSKL